MQMRTILVPLDGTDAARPAMETAFMLGRDLAAHLDVLHVRPDPKDAVPLLGEGMSGAIIEEMIELAEKEAGELTTDARAMFDDFCSRYSVPVVEGPPAPGAMSASWIEKVGREDETTVWRGRLADLVVVRRPTAQSDVSSTMILNSVLFETGRPILVAPPEAPAAVGRKVAVAWNGSSQASRAVAAAMPFLVASSGVVVLIAETARTAAAFGDELAAYLAWHGVIAETRVIPQGERPVGAMLLAAAAEVGADLLVMGAYSHSRMRQLILGGVTKLVLAESTLPILMAH